MSEPRATRKGWYWLLLLPYIAILWIPAYNRVEPTAFGIPFYYWYQLACVLLSAAAVGLALYLAHTRPNARTGKR